MQVNFSILPLNPFKKEKTNQVKYTFLKQKAVWIFSEVNTFRKSGVIQCNKLIIGLMHYNFDLLFYTGKGFSVNKSQVFNSRPVLRVAVLQRGQQHSSPFPSFALLRGGNIIFIFVNTSF